MGKLLGFVLLVGGLILYRGHEILTWISEKVSHALS